MLSKHIISVAAATLFGLIQASGVSHGDVGEYDGNVIRWHQRAEGVFTAVDDEEWDDHVHKRSDEIWDLASSGSLVHRDLEDRNLQSFCQSVTDCYKEDGLVQVVGCMGAVLQAADLARQGAQTIWDVLQKPIIATYVGATCAGITTYKLTVGSTPAPAECSTSDDPKDVLYSALAAAVAANPNANEIAVDIVGPTTIYTVTITAAPEGTEPTTPVAGQCFTA